MSRVNAPSLHLPARHRAALLHTGTVVTAIGADQWSAPTPCADWDVRALVNHVVAGNHWAARLGAGETIAQVGTDLDGDLLGDDPVAAYDASAEPAARVFERHGAMDAMCAVSYGPVPGSMYAGHRFIDVLVHGWDMAVATGQDAELPEELVEACWRVVEPQLAMLAGSGMFGDPQPIPTDADIQTRLLATLGRRV